MRDAVIVSACRTAIGRSGGVFREVPADDLGAVVVAEAAKRAGITGDKFDDLIMGCCVVAGPCGNMARHIGLKAGFPDTVPALTVDRRCASGLQAVTLAAQAIQTHNADVVMAGGTENMTRSPYILDKIAEPYKRGSLTMYDSFGGPKAQPVSIYGDLTMGITAENVAERYNVSREDQDRFALRSQQRACAAIAEGRFKDETVPVEAPGPKKGEKVAIDTDEHPRPDTTLEKLARLQPSFKKGGTVTAGNSSGINDGAAALVVMGADTAAAMGIKPLARVLGHAAVAVDPAIMGIGPSKAIPKALARAGLKKEDLGLIEINEAFASMMVANLRLLDLNEDIVNVNGGAIAMGHPIGCSGARILTTLLYEMRRRRVRYGVASLCIGGGQGMATVVENLAA
jgi:acetyl-CoA C-acetyltransferase